MSDVVEKARAVLLEATTAGWTIHGRSREYVWAGDVLASEGHSIDVGNKKDARAIVLSRNCIGALLDLLEAAIGESHGPTHRAQRVCLVCRLRAALGGDKT